MIPNQNANLHKSSHCHGVSNKDLRVHRWIDILIADYISTTRIARDGALNTAHHEIIIFTPFSNAAETGEIRPLMYRWFDCILTS